MGARIVATGRAARLTYDVGMPERPFAIVRRPAETLADGIVTFIERRPVDLELAKRQWDGYVAALHRSGVPCLTNRGERGGTPVTVAAIHALLFHRDPGAPSA